MGLIEFITLTFVVAKVFGVGDIATWSWLKVFTLELWACGFYILIFIYFIVGLKKRWF